MRMNDQSAVLSDPLHIIADRKPELIRIRKQPIPPEPVYQEIISAKRILPSEKHVKPDPIPQP